MDPRPGSRPGPPLAALPRGVLILLGLAAATITVAGLRAVSGILGPVALALVLSIAAEPVRGLVTSRGAPRWVGTLLTVLAVYAVLLVISVSLVVAAARFASLVPAYQDELARLLGQVTDRLDDLGVDRSQTQAMVDSFDLGRLARLVAGVLAGLAGVLTSLVFVVTLVLFLCLDSQPFVRHLASVREGRPEFVTALVSFALGTRTYLLVSTAFGLLVAVIDTVVLYALGVPAALLWGLLAFVTNYIPNIGFVLGLAPPAVLALLEGGPGLMIAVVVVYCVVNVVIQSVIQPKMVGDAVGLSASVTFVSLVVWSWILGPVGAVLAVPLSLLVRAIFVDVDPSTRWVAGLIGTPAEVSVPAARTLDEEAGGGEPEPQQDVEGDRRV